MDRPADWTKLEATPEAQDVRLHPVIRKFRKARASASSVERFPRPLVAAMIRARMVLDTLSTERQFSSSKGRGKAKM